MSDPGSSSEPVAEPGSNLGQSQSRAMLIATASKIKMKMGKCHIINVQRSGFNLRENIPQ